MTLRNQTCCRILVQSLDSPRFLHGNLQSISFPFWPSSQCSQTISSIACVVSPGCLRNPELHRRDLPVQGVYAIQNSTDVTFQSTDFCQTATRFDLNFWSAARQLYFIFSVALRGCRHQIIDDVQVTQVTV